MTSMETRKVYCEIVEGVTYDDRCLFKLSKVIEANRTCESCLLRELERLKRGLVKEAESPKKSGRKKRPKEAGRISKDRRGMQDTKDVNIPHGIDISRDMDDLKRSLDVRDLSEALSRESEDLRKSLDVDDWKETLTVQEVSQLLGKSKRRIQELAKERKIPAYKPGPHWAFNKEEIDKWLSEKKHSVIIM